MNEKISPCNRARQMFQRSRPSSVRAFGPATFPGGEGDLPAGDALFQSALDL